MDPIMNMDLYELIGAQSSATVQEIKKAYRKKALSCHPDKNPDNPRAAELFLELSKALEILTDASARAAYDKVLTAKQQAKLRVRELDVKRRKLKEELEAREEAYLRSMSNACDVKTDEQKLQAEIERLQKEGSRQVEEEVAFVKKKIYEQLHGSKVETNENSIYNRIKIRWKVVKDDPCNGGYDYNTLHRILSKYGDISALIISSAKKGRALVEFQNRSAAKTAAQIESGLVDNPLKLTGLWPTETVITPSAEDSSFAQSHRSSRLFPIQRDSSESTKTTFPSFSSAPNIFQNRVQTSDADFESSVLTSLRRAEERKRLLEKLKAEEDT